MAELALQRLLAGSTYFSKLSKSTSVDLPDTETGNVKKLGLPLKYVLHAMKKYDHEPSNQWPFQDPRLEVPSTYKAYVRPM